MQFKDNESTILDGKSRSEQALCNCREELSLPGLASTASEKVRYIQNMSGFNNKELGDIFGVSRRSIQNWATGSAVSETNTEKIDMFFTKIMSMSSLKPEELRNALLSSTNGESFVQEFKRSIQRGEKILVPTPIEGRFVQEYPTHMSPLFLCTQTGQLFDNKKRSRIESPQKKETLKCSFLVEYNYHEKLRFVYKLYILQLSEQQKGTRKEYHYGS